MENNPSLKSGLHENLLALKQRLGESDDLLVREFQSGAGGVRRDMVLLYIDGLAEEKMIQQFILEPLFQTETAAGGKEIVLEQLPGYLKNSVLTAGQVAEVGQQEPAADALINGFAILLVDGCASCLKICMANWEQRTVSEPSNQSVIRGPKEAFTENIRVNTALIRRIIKNPSVILKNQQIGKVTKTNVSIMYVQGIADETALKEVNRRLSEINTDAILESGYIEEFIQDETYTLYPTVQNTERPDVVAAAILEGRIAILIDGTPHVLLVPALFVQFLQSAEDYYQRADISSLLRILRYFGLFIAALVPALYIAVTTFHQEMLPTQLLISLAAQREGVPFPAFIEAMIMEATYEILREAGIRMPRTVGQAVSIVGTLVIGQAAVEAGIISASMIIVVSITAISSYVIPEFDMSIAVRITRFLFMGLAAAFGMFGIFIGLLALLLHLSSLRSFGVPYMAPEGPITFQDQKDVIVRVPHPGLRKRPSMFSKLNPVRQRKSKGKNGS
ncbi:spore germination protein [Paenibacillus montanisoli]|uniref:Spore germination protein n=1 Tax=Paenibacillus montanisoli TaxID=2081970 RepID=A0A328U1A3_9BACL|nr:spore germination protein [Paenibacillus montanisoli]RAP75842.1 spore germination protein [Paenibacillus montanisoli]